MVRTAGGTVGDVSTNHRSRQPLLFFLLRTFLYTGCQRDESRPGPLVASICLNCGAAFRATRREPLAPADKMPRCGSCDLSLTFPEARSRRNIWILFYRVRGRERGSRCVGALELCGSRVSNGSALQFSGEQSRILTFKRKSSSNKHWDLIVLYQDCQIIIWNANTPDLGLNFHN